MRIIDKVLNLDNLNNAMYAVIDNKGAPGIDGMTVEELPEYFMWHKTEVITAILEGRYQPSPVKRVYIPKANGKMRPLGIPTVVDRTIQQAITQVLTSIFDPTFSEHSHGFRPGRSCHTAMDEVLGCLNAGKTWVVDFDIEKYFDTVNHDKLISIIREKCNDRLLLHLIRSFLAAGVMEDGLCSPTEEGVPQGGPLSPLLSNIYLDKLDKELEARGLQFVRYADDFDIFVSSRLAAERVKASVTSWLQRKLFLRVSAEKTKVVRPTKSEFLGFGFWKKPRGGWQCRVADSRKARIKAKLAALTERGKAAGRAFSQTVREVNQALTGWLSYYSYGAMRTFLEKELGPWLRHRLRMILFKQWKRPRTIYKNLQWYNRRYKVGMSHESIFKVANSRLGLFKQTTGNVVNYLISPEALQEKISKIWIDKKGKKHQKVIFPGLVNPVAFYEEHFNKFHHLNSSSIT